MREVVGLSYPLSLVPPETGLRPVRTIALGGELLVHVRHSKNYPHVGGNVTIVGGG